MFAASSPGCHSHLYNSIRSYLHNQNRAQPIIGLNSITEVLAYNRTALYFCDVCILRITKADIRNHIMGSIHRYNYIKSHHVHGWTSDTDLTLLARPLMDISKKVEKKEGTGDIQVLSVDEVIYKEMTSLPVPDAFAQMKKIKDQRNPNAPDLLVHKRPSEVKETSTQGQQVPDHVNETAQHPNSGCLVPTRCVSTTPRSKCLNMIEPQQVSTTPMPNPCLYKTAGPIKPLFACQNVSTPPSVVDSHISFRMPFLESSPAPVLSQPINQHQPIPVRILQRCIMPSESQCFSEARTISVVRPPRQCIPIRTLCENDTVRAAEDYGSSSVQSFGVGYESHPLHLAQTIPYELQTSSLSVSHVAPELTQDVTNRHGFFMNESSSDRPQPVRDVDIVIKQIRTQMLKETLQSATTHDLILFHNESNLKEQINSGWEAHEEPQSDTLVEENTFVFSQSPIAQSPLTQTQSPSDQFQSVEDFLENYCGPRPLIGLQAVVKCQSVDGNPPPCCYLCQLCSLKLKKKKIFGHLTGCDHQRNYLKALHPQLLPKKRKRCNTNDMLKDIAIKLEKEEGRGHIKVMRLSACLMSEVLEKDYRWCMRVLNCGANAGWKSSLLSFKEGTNNTIGPSQTLKRPSGSMLPPSDARRGGAPTHQMSKKMKKGHPKKVLCTKRVKEPVFKVSLSLQEGPVIIERTSLRDTGTVAPEIEDHSPATTSIDNDAPPLATNTHSEVQKCFDGSEEEFTNSAHHAYSVQFDQPQVVQCFEPSLRPRDCGPVDEVVTFTYADCPLQDWSCINNQWILMRQNRDGNDYSECASYMQY
ncbi:uncharacterized protein si:ch211-199g17.2 [Puntigrus tetrazona]|uniref:uncharacterized protein si:ch211-199g17.2 n=1 Tax=Puntigrus tetrazona TaxID=1606681 RepID=UPI001C88F681|nr:uncharacterized protein si:ch211-199g17.2 [Puntigrus tetrazona]